MTHLKRHVAPKTWNLKRKEAKYTTAPQPGSHGVQFGMPARTLFKTMIPLATTSIEVDRMMREQIILVNGSRVINPKRVIGLLDILAIPSIEKNFRIEIAINGQLTAKEISTKDAATKLSKIVSKVTQSKDTYQITLHDGRTMLTKEEYKIGDSVIIDIQGKKIVEHIKLEEGQKVYITGGKHIGDVGAAVKIAGDKITYKLEKEEVTTLKKYAFAVPEKFEL